MKLSKRVSIEKPINDLHWITSWVLVDGMIIARCPSQESTKIVADALSMYLEAQSI